MAEKNVATKNETPEEILLFWIGETMEKKDFLNYFQFRRGFEKKQKIRMPASTLSRYLHGEKPTEERFLALVEFCEIPETVTQKMRDLYGEDLRTCLLDRKPVVKKHSKKVSVRAPRKKRTIVLPTQIVKKKSELKNAQKSSPKKTTPKVAKKVVKSEIKKAVKKVAKKSVPKEPVITEIELYQKLLKKVRLVIKKSLSQEQKRLLFAVASLSFE